MRLIEGEIELVGTPAEAGDPRAGSAVELIVVVDDARPAEDAVAAFTAAESAAPPNYYIDRAGSIRQLVADARAGRSLALAIHRGRRRNLDRISLSVLLERPEGDDYSDGQVAALHRLLAFLRDQHGLPEEALATILPDDKGRPRVFPYLPPPTSVTTGEVLGAALDPAQELFVALYAETYKPRGGTLKIDQAFPIHAARFGLGAPVGKNEPPPLSVGGRSFNFQPFARDVIFNEGTDYAAVVQLSSLVDPDRAEIPASGPARALLEAAYKSSLKASRAAGVPLKGRETLEPGWRFHQVAHNAGYGPPLSGNYVSDDGKYAVQVFAGETLYTPVTDQAGCRLLSTTDPADPAYDSIWRETYKVACAPYDPDSPFHKKALELKLGAPLSGVYEATLVGARYKVQVWALDTLYQGDDGAIRRMSELYLPLGRNVVIYGGGLVGVELAEFLSERHRKVTVIEPGPSFGKELMIVRRWRIMDTLRRLGVTLLPSAELLEIKPDRVVYRTKSAQIQSRWADSVIIAAGATPDGTLADSLRKVCDAVYCIGDANELGYIEGAVRSANRIAREI